MPEPSRAFVLLEHTTGNDRHWDLMLDTGERLATWRLLEDPHLLAGPAVLDGLRARRIGDHRRAYLDYEGPVSGNRGTVARVDRGTYAALQEQPDYWVVILAGTLLSGRFRLVLDPTFGTSGDQWILQRFGA
jgi:hypothetical protein